MRILECESNSRLKVIIECTADTVIWNNDRIQRLGKRGYVVAGIQPPPQRSPHQDIHWNNLLDEYGSAGTLDRIGLHFPAFFIMSPAIASFVGESEITDMNFEAVYDAWMRSRV